MKILLVEDDENIVALLTATLSKQNYVLDIALDGAAGWEMVRFSAYDLILLDIGLPELDGLSFCRRLREIGNQSPVLLLTARDAESDRVLGLDSGADDYVIKPFNLAELTARIRALLRRGNTAGSPLLTCGKLCLDPGTRTVTYDSQAILFSRKEYLIVELFLRNQKYVFSRDTIIDRLWSVSEDPPGEDTIKSHIKNIRRKLKTVYADDLIETLYGQGYRINPKYAHELSATEASEASNFTYLSGEDRLAQTALEIWERTKEMSFERIEMLKQTSQLLQTNSLTQGSLSCAIQAAHKLAGSLGTFGFENGSRLARMLEQTLEAAEQSRRIEPAAAELSLAHYSQGNAKSLLLPQSLQQELYQQIQPLVTALCDGVVRQDNLNLLDHSTTWKTTHASVIPANQASNSVDLTVKALEQPCLLIVDSDRNLAEILASEAQAHNFRTAIATDLNAAKAAIQAASPNIVLVDSACIVAGTESLITVLAKQLPHLPLVVISDPEEMCDRTSEFETNSCLFLQRSLAPAQVVQAISDFLKRSCRAKGKILAVDDDLQILATLKSILEPQGFQVVGLDDPTQFWHTLNAIEPDFLILDINMEPISGIELCQSVRHNLQWNWLPILFLTAQTDWVTLEQAFAVGGDDYIAKPIAPSELYARLLSRWQRIQSLQNQGGHSLTTCIKS